ncbi:hypothetical protein FRB96_000595 [Tulasnella sp. 330]|nr:hypothetical protein FRB96_000595 [Tulasnella sp. 330]
MPPFHPELASLGKYGRFQEEDKRGYHGNDRRNTITPDVHSFAMQGTDRLHLVYLPQFCKANSRIQLILWAGVSQFQEDVTAAVKSPDDQSQRRRSDLYHNACCGSFFWVEAQGHAGPKPAEAGSIFLGTYAAIVPRIQQLENVEWNIRRH